jgi:hypothetical protein
MATLLVRLCQIVDLPSIPVRCATVLDRQAWALLRRLTCWLDRFKQQLNTTQRRTMAQGNGRFPGNDSAKSLVPE